MKELLETKDRVVYKGLPTKEGILEYLKNRSISNSLDYYQLVTLYTIDEDSIIDETHVITKTKNKSFKAITIIEKAGEIDKNLPY